MSHNRTGGNLTNTIPLIFSYYLQATNSTLTNLGHKQDSKLTRN